MMSRSLTLGVTLLAAAALTPTVSATLVDGLGDAQDVLGFGAPLLDIDTITVQYDATHLYFDMTFHTPITAPSGGLPDGLFGLLEFDTDQSSATGAPAVQGLFAPPFASLDVGVDYIVDLASEIVMPGQFAVVDAVTFTQVAIVDATYGPQSLSGSVELSALGGDDGVVNFTTTIGTFDQPTDATDQVGTSKLIPAPASAVLLLGLLGGRRRRRA